MILGYLIGALIISFVNMGILMCLTSNRTKSYYTTMFQFMTIQIAGHLFLALSSNIEEALLANKIAYAGAVYSPMLFILGELALCNIKISKAFEVTLFTVGTIVFGLAATTGWSDIYYKSIQLIQNNGVTDYVAEFGPAHRLFDLLLIFYLISGVCILIYSLLKKKNISYRNLLGLASIGVFGISSFFVLRSLQCDMLLFPIINIIIEFTIIIIAHRVGKYDIQATILDSLEFQNESAFISFTLDKRYIGCNNIALERFPILKDFRVDSKISEDNDLSKILLKQIDGFATNNNGLAENFQYGKMHYKSYLRNLFHGNKICGYMFRIEDDTKIQRYIKLLDQYNNDLIADVRNKDSHIKNIQQQMILGMANMVECRDRNTIGHFQRTSEITRILVDEMKKDDNFRTLSNFLDNVANAAPMHDLGKIAVDDAILRKPGKFTPEEYEVMKTHAEKGAAIVENLLRGIEPDEVVGIARNVANYHHERWDGTGYPRHLKGEEIPFESRIVAIADVYDALVSFRCYKEKMSYAEAFDTIVSGMGTQFDPKLKKYFINCHKEFEAYYDSCENK